MRALVKSDGHLLLGFQRLLILHPSFCAGGKVSMNGLVASN